MTDTPNLLSRETVEALLKRAQNDVVRYGKDVLSKNFEIANGSKHFLNKAVFEAELARGYLTHLDWMVGVKSRSI